MVADEHVLAELQLELHSHVGELSEGTTGNKVEIILHIYLLLHPGQQVSHVSLVGALEVDFGGGDGAIRQSRTDQKQEGHNQFDLH